MGLRTFCEVLRLTSHGLNGGIGYLDSDDWRLFVLPVTSIFYTCFWFSSVSSVLDGILKGACIG